MLLFLVLCGIVGIIVFHTIPAIVYMLVWYTLAVTLFYITERYEERHK